MSSSENKVEGLLADFQAVAQTAEVEYIIQRSRFLGYASYCDSAQQARHLLAGRAGLYRSANHHCYAWIIDPEKGEHHYSDDQEPSGSAGRPIYHTLLSLNLRRTLVVVSRYFGGVKLGIRGLIDAYSHTARLAIDRAGISLYTWGELLEVELDYPQWDTVRYDMEKMGLCVDHGSMTYTSQIHFTIFIPNHRRNEVESWADRCRGKSGDMKIDWQGIQVLRSENQGEGIVC